MMILNTENFTATIFVLLVMEKKKPCLSVKGCQKSYLDIKLAPPRIVK